VSASIGIAFAQEGDDPDTLLRHADAAMYKVKEGGRGTYEIFLDAL
jgi:GGDEF domain-containing protein